MNQIQTTAPSTMIDISNPVSCYLDSAVFEQLQRVGQLLAASQFVPKHLQKKPQDCFLVVGQALRWGMDPFAVAQCTYVVHGSLGYEGKIVTAAINTCGKLENNLAFDYEGEGKNRSCTVSGKLKGEKKIRTVTVVFKDVRSDNPHWDKSTDQMLSYRGSRDWARRHMPEAMLGIKSVDELNEQHQGSGNALNVTPVRPSRAGAIEAFDNPPEFENEEEAELGDPIEYSLTSIHGEIIKEIMVMEEEPYSNKIYNAYSDYLTAEKLTEAELEIFKEYNEPAFDYVAQNDRQSKALNGLFEKAAPKNKPVSQKIKPTKIERENSRQGAGLWREAFLEQLESAPDQAFIDDLVRLNHNEAESMKKVFPSTYSQLKKAITAKQHATN